MNNPRIIEMTQYRRPNDKTIKVVPLEDIRQMIEELKEEMKEYQNFGNKSRMFMLIDKHFKQLLKREGG